jgi:hypothetical protein
VVGEKSHYFWHPASGCGLLLGSGSSSWGRFPGFLFAPFSIISNVSASSSNFGKLLQIVLVILALLHWETTVTCWHGRWWTARTLPSLKAMPRKPFSLFSLDKFRMYYGLKSLELLFRRKKLITSTHEQGTNVRIPP